GPAGRAPRRAPPAPAPRPPSRPGACRRRPADRPSGRWWRAGRASGSATPRRPGPARRRGRTARRRSRRPGRPGRRRGPAAAARGGRCPPCRARGPRWHRSAGRGTRSPRGRSPRGRRGGGCQSCPLLSQRCCQSASTGDNGPVNRTNGGPAPGLRQVTGGGAADGTARGAGGVTLLPVTSHISARVLYLLRAAGPGGISRLEVAERTGLTPQAVSKITARLREDGLAVEAGRRASTGGKPRTVLRLVPEAGHAVGVHLDRDGLRAVLADLDGTVVAERHTPLDLGAGAEAVLTRVAEVV